MKTFYTFENSSVFKSFEYDSQTQQLTLNFHNEVGYEYNSIPANIVNQLKNAPSPGQFFTRKILNGNYDFRKI